MKNISAKIERGTIDDKLRQSILQTFKKRVEGLQNIDFNATIVINPILCNYQSPELISGNCKRYLIDTFGIIDEETKIRLATLMASDKNLSLLYIFDICHKEKISDVQVSESIIPRYLSEELEFVTSIINVQQNALEKTHNTFCISGDDGNGKTSFVKVLANRIHVKLWHLTYSDIDAENTALISQKIDSFFNKIATNDFVVIENTNAFLCGHDINRFVKNILLSRVAKKKNVYFFIETNNPSEFDYELKHLIFRYIYIKPTSEIDRLRYLQYFLSRYDIIIEMKDLNGLNTTGLTVKNLEEVAFVTKINYRSCNKLYDCICKSIDEVHSSVLHSAISSDSLFSAKKPKYKLEDLILPDEQKETIKYAASLISNVSIVYNCWNFSSIDPYPRAILNFFGKPGTGKTMCAHAIADFLGKDLLALNYAEIESKYIGDAPKKLESAFAYARQHDTVMFFDEADSFLGKRIEDVSHSADQALNSLRSTMLIQLEMFEGVVIFATNLRDNYDKAFKSRFLYEIEFNLPDYESREKMLELYLRKIVPLSKAKFTAGEIGELSQKSAGLSGREIKSAILEALNKLAYIGFKGTAEEAIMPYHIVCDCITKKSIKNSSGFMLSRGSEDEKKMIGAELAKEYNNSKDAEHNTELTNLVTIAYLAAWSDGILNEKELSIIKEAEKELKVELPYNYTKQENLPDLHSALLPIIKADKKQQALELCCRIVAADGEYTKSELVFIHNVCKELNMSDNQILSVDEMIKYMAKESEILGTLYGSKTSEP